MFRSYGCWGEVVWSWECIYINGFMDILGWFCVNVLFFLLIVVFCFLLNFVGVEELEI